MADAHHAEWLSLLDISGPFLSPPVLDRVFPQGLDAADSDHTAKLRLAYEEWAEEQQKVDPDPAIHDAWIRFILTESLGLTPEVLLQGEGVLEELEFTSPEHGETIRPDFVVFDPEDEPRTRKARLLISVWPAGTEVDQPVDDARWTASPIDRMIALCRSEHVGLRLGLVTNGERWALVDAPVGETSAHASWYANLWGPEPLTLRAFRSLLGLRRFFGVVESDRLDAMLVESANYQTEVTDQLGFQVRRAVEVLVQAIDRADADTGRTLLADTEPARIYEAALTVMMRLVFLFSAEERGLLRLGDPMYDQFYAVSTLHAQLQEAADLVGPEVLERRQDAWSRLLGTFRAIYGGIHHQDLQIIPYGSSLFEPDRFPFLEGRTDDTTWQDTDSLPLPIDNRTVLLLLRSLQMLDLGKGKGARKLSFRALDIEQIGHVYETLLDHSAYRATEPMVSLQGNQGLEPEVPISKLIGLVLHDSDEPLVEYLKSELKKGVNPIRKALERGRTPQPDSVARLRRSCGGDEILLGKLLPFNELIRLDPWGEPVVIQKGAVFVTAGEDRRSTGTHYTPRALTEEIVQYALEPVVYRGPAEGKDRQEWELKSPNEILDLKVCDPAMGSGAFLVQACRYLSERLVEAWEQTAQVSGYAGGDVIPTDAEEQLSLARRLVADRCLYGVDVNPLAVEMAKLSMWLITLARDAPFTFLDHALKCGDSLIGIHDPSQLREFHVDPARGRRIHTSLFGPREYIEEMTGRATEHRRELEGFTTADIYAALRKATLENHAAETIDAVRALGDIVVGIEYAGAGSAEAARDEALVDAAALVGDVFRRAAAGELPIDGIADLLRAIEPTIDIRPFHWPIEFPEVWKRDVGGFDSIVGNPPFMRGKSISTNLGSRYRETVMRLTSDRPGSADLVAFFLLRASQLTDTHAGTVGMLATNTVAQGDTREVGLDQLHEAGRSIYRAESNRSWPGSASVTISQVWFTGRAWSGRSSLDGHAVIGISPYLAPKRAVDGPPAALMSNAEMSFQGTVIGGKGFLLSESEADMLLAAHPDHEAVIRPYLSGADILGQVSPVASRYVIDFGDRRLEQAEDFPAALSLVRERVKPSRDRAKRKTYRERWWRFAEPCFAMYQALEPLSDVVVLPQTARHVVPAFASTDQVLSQTLVVFASDSMSLFGLLASTVHREWALAHGSTLQLNPRYTPTDCFETLPIPEGLEAIEEAAAEYYRVRRSLMASEHLGLTQAYNVLCNPDDVQDAVEGFRRAQVALDRAVFTAYGWSDIDVRLGFESRSQGVRFTFPRDLLSEVIDRLLLLNGEAHALEEPTSRSRFRLSRAAAVSRSQESTLFDQGMAN